MEERMLSTKEVTEMTGLSRWTIERYIEKGEFPQKEQLTERRVAWKKSAIVKWMEGE